MYKKLISFLILCVFLWMIWSFAGRNQPLPPAKGVITHVETINPDDSLQNTLIGIQPYMLVSDYFSHYSFKEKLSIYLREAKSRGLFRKNTVILFPEYLGTWLVIEGEKHGLMKKKNLEDAIKTMVFSNFFEFGIQYLYVGSVQDKAIAALFHMKAIRMAKSYFFTFSELAQEFDCYILGGSIILPGPYVSKEGDLMLDHDKPLFNASFLFGPDGKIIGSPIYKAFPTESEQAFSSAYPSDKLPVFDLPLGKTSVMISADSWYPGAYQDAGDSHVEIILVPSYSPGEQAMNQLWPGYSGYPPPLDTELKDIGKITEGEAWEKYALPARIRSIPAHIGMNVFLKGELWDLGADGQPQVISRTVLSKSAPRIRLEFGP